MYRLNICGHTVLFDNTKLPIVNQLVSVSIITRDRTNELEAVLRSIREQEYQNYEIIIGDNGSEEHNLKIIRDIAARTSRVRLIELGQNLGVSGGRNAVLKQCIGDVILEIDDDALLENPAIFTNGLRRMQEEPDIGILAFKVVNYHTRGIDRHEFPFLTKKREPDLEGEATWFIGCGHIFRRELVEKIGFYHDFFPYGQEELDYSLRALDSGFRIVYDPRLIVLHKKSLTHRITDPTVWGALNFKNRLKVALLNLPILFCFTYFVFRGLLYSKFLRYPAVFPRALSDLRGEWDYIVKHRRPIKWTTVLRILKLRGPLFF